MSTPSRSGTRHWSRRVLSVLASILALVVLQVVSITAAQEIPFYVQDSRPDGTYAMSDLGNLAYLVAFLLNLSIFWRRRHPWVVWGIGAGIALVLQLDPLLMFLGMSELIARRPLKQWRLGAVGAGAVGIIVLIRNAVTDTTWIPRPPPDAATLIAYGIVPMGIGYGVTFMLGWLRRSRRELESADAHLEQAQQHVAGLTDELARQSERERLAREIHDALAHRLSLVSLHSGALEEVARAGDGRVTEAAQVVRDNAHRSLEDLRDLVGALRDPHRAGPVTEPAQIPLHGMANVAEVIDSTIAAGVQVNAFVMLSDPEQAGALLNRAVFRIVQEALTNVVKHAPGSSVGLDLRAAPGSGVLLRIRNPLTGAPSGLPGSGSGLIGMQERVAALDGQITVGPTADGWFEVSVQLPWAAVDDPATPGPAS
ncbi:hypothetical protein CGZ96_11565 [Enemella evansiae]|uniref:sensor histidine kinase n=1 Tax=Enemella evansiae TaxID=2016499 RepID=UPI000B96AC69|nr:histidine kinase [Enemella evansiae]OYN96915.1 hypothetical protein CGZ96_11565 [Enemella evansiae]OYO00653.1 hypothetical protein CGZ95_08445 [Enemella evansiae]